MGKRGPKPLPTALKRARGTLQKCREAPNALELPPGVPACPSTLDKDARAIWDELAANEEWRVVLARADVFALELLVKHMALERKFSKAAEARPMVKTPWGPKPNPAAAEARKEAALVKQLAAEFGLTPSARTRVSGPGSKDPKEDSKKKAAAFLFGGLKALPGGKGA